MAKKDNKLVPYDENDAKLLAMAKAASPAPAAPPADEAARSLGNAMAALWKTAESAASPPVEAPPASSAASIEDAMSALWVAAEQKANEPPVQRKPQGPPEPTYFPPALEVVLPEEGERRPYRELSSERIRKALWAGTAPTPDEMFTLTTCRECRKPMWTRMAREETCEECFLALHVQMEMELQAARNQGFTPGSGIVNPLMR